MVNVRDQLSTPIEVISGVPQGSVLGPLLSVIFINDMPSIFLDAIPWLYADDLELLFHSIIYQDDLTRLHLWNISNEMLANRTKTKCLVFRGNVSIVFNNETLENVDYQK